MSYAQARFTQVQELVDILEELEVSKELIQHWDKPREYLAELHKIEQRHSHPHETEVDQLPAGATIKQLKAAVAKDAQEELEATQLMKYIRAFETDKGRDYFRKIYSQDYAIKLVNELRAINNEAVEHINNVYKEFGTWEPTTEQILEVDAASTALQDLKDLPKWRHQVEVVDKVLSEHLVMAYDQVATLPVIEVNDEWKYRTYSGERGRLGITYKRFWVVPAAQSSSFFSGGRAREELTEVQPVEEVQKLVQCMWLQEELAELLNRKHRCTYPVGSSPEEAFIERFPEQEERIHEIEKLLSEVG